MFAVWGLVNRRIATATSRLSVSLTVQRAWQDFGSIDGMLTRVLRLSLRLIVVSSVSTPSRRLFAFFRVNERNRDISPFIADDELIVASLLGWRDYIADE